MSLDLNPILNQLVRDKGINKTVLIEAIEAALLSAARKHYGHHLNLECRFDDETGMVEVLQFKSVVERIEDADTQLSLEEARRDYDVDAMVGDEFGKKLDASVLGRIAAQTAKQVIVQKVRDAERGVIYEEFKNSKGELVNGIVMRFDRGNIVVNLGRTEAVLPAKEQIRKERYRRGDRLRALIIDIDPSARGPQIVLSRSHPDFLRKLFEIEVPEISEKIVDIKLVAREPGERAKIAVYSKDASVDPVGACVGIKGSRVHAVVQEMRGERIDIIPWTEDQPSFVARALSPAEVSKVMVDEDEHAMVVIVPDDQLSNAIGRNGQNVKLASRLSGWKIDVRSVSTAEEESRRARNLLSAIPGIQFTHAEILFQAGYRGIREVSEAAVSEIADLDGFNDEMAESVVNAAKDLVESGKLEELEAETGGSAESVSDLDGLHLTPEIRAKLEAAGYSSLQKLIEAAPEEIDVVEDLTEAERAEVRDAINVFLSRDAAGKGAVRQ
jgi:N utilization substance protein A